MQTNSDSRWFWMLFGPAALVAMGWAGWSALGTAGAPTPQVGLSAADARQRDLLEQNLGKPGDAALGQKYRAINEEHFDGALPTIPVIWEPRLAEVGALAAQAFTLEGMFGHVGNRAAILLNPDLQADPKALKRALCHEMVHAYLFSVGSSDSGHGAQFQDVLRRLSLEGAFTGLVATEREREDLRAWLNAETARLDAEHVAMAREGAEIERERRELERVLTETTARTGPEWEALNARREAYNLRALDANARAARDRIEVAEFNARAERYNLMISYPDGVDENRVKPRARR